jgi:PD-(D/E)XK nuclease superfamily
LADAYTNSYNEPIQVMATEIRNALRIADLKKVESILNSVFKSLPYEVWQKENEHFYHAIIHLTFRLLGIYVESQVQTSDGRMDALVKVNDYVYAFEFKLDESAEEALKQVKDKGYLQPYFHQNKTCIGVGLNFSTATKKVEKLIWEEINS